MSQILNPHDKLPDALHAELTGEIEDATLVARAQEARTEFLGTISPEGMTDMIARSRRAFLPNAFFGYRLGRQVSFVVNVDAERTKSDFPAVGGDLFVTDADGFCKNHLLDANGRERMAQAKRLGRKTVLVFGGSTIMGVGSRRPEYSIPALLERVLKEKHGVEATCINLGISGSFCLDALNVLIADGLTTPPDAVVFYDGWNCCHNLKLTTGFQDAGPALGHTPIYPGTSLARLDHDMAIYQQFALGTLIKKSAKLSAVKFMTALSNIGGSTAWRNICKNVVERFFSLKPHVFARLAQATPIRTPEQIAQASADVYWHIHRMAKACCASTNTAFMTVFQPVMWWGNKPLSKTEQKYHDAAASVQAEHLAFYQAVAQKSRAAEMLDLTTLFDQDREDIYIDSGHLNRLGNYLVAEQIAFSLKDTLK